MAYVKKVWKSTQGSGLNKFRVGNLGVYPLVSTPDEITEEGDILSANNFNNFESRIEDAFNSVDNEKAGKSTTVNGKSLSSNIVLTADDIPFDNSSTTLVSTNVKDAIIEASQTGGGGGGGVSEQWVKDNTIASYSTLPSPQDISNGKAIWDETGKRLLISNGNEFIELVPTIIDVTELPTTNINKKVLYRIVGTGGTYTALYFYDDKDNNFKSIPTMEYLAYAFGTAFQNIDTTLQGISTNLRAVKNAVAFEWIKGAGGSGINVDSCIFNLISSDVIGTDTQPIVKKESFVCNFTDPVTSSNTYGECETTQYFIRHLTGRVNYIVFEQVVTKYVQNASNTLKMIRRGSYVISDENFNYFTDVTNLTSTDITWTDWSLIDYPKTNLTLSNTTDFSVNTFCFSVSGRNVTIFIGGLRQLVDTPSNNIFATIPAYLKSANGYEVAMVVDGNTFNTFATLSEMNSNNSLSLNGAITGGIYYGSISYGIGY